jgi:hypothetical protein
MQRVRVRFNRNVLGRKAGTVDMVEATPMVETLVRVGYLKWLDEPADEPVVERSGWDDPAPDEDLASLEKWAAEREVPSPDDWYLDDQDGLIELPTGEVIGSEELLDRLAFEDDGGPPFDQDDNG